MLNASKVCGIGRNNSFLIKKIKTWRKLVMTYETNKTEVATYIFLKLKIDFIW